MGKDLIDDGILRSEKVLVLSMWIRKDECYKIECHP